MIVITGCSTVGKTSLAKLLLAKYPKLYLVPSITTREERDDDLNYIYLTNEEFERCIEDNKLVDYNQVFNGCWYGTAYNTLIKIHESGRVPLVVTDNHGAKNFMEKLAPCIINLVPRDRANIEWRIRNFRTDHIEERIASLDVEIQDDGYFEHTFKLQELDECIEQIYDLVERSLGIK